MTKPVLDYIEEDQLEQKKKETKENEEEIGKQQWQKLSETRGKHCYDEVD